MTSKRVNDVEDVETTDAAAYVVVVDDVHAALESVRVPARSMTAAVDGLVRSLLIPTAVVAGAHLDAGGGARLPAGGSSANAVATPAGRRRAAHRPRGTCTAASA